MSWEVNMMKSKKSCKWLSGVLILQNIKRFWLIPVLGSVALFFCSIMPMLGYHRKNELYFLIESQLDQTSPVFVLILAIVPIFAATAAFAYLHRKSSAAAIHTQPFSRNKLYTSHMISGWILTVIPVLFLGICYFAMIQITGFQSLAEGYGHLTWFSFITVTYVYAVSVLAAQVAGTVVTHFLLSIFFNGILPVTVLLVNRYMMRFLWGFTQPALSSANFSPLSIMYNQWYYDHLIARISTGADSYIFISRNSLFLLFLLAAAVLLWISGRIYKRLPLEREGESVVFKWPGEAVCYLFAFIGMTLTAFFTIRVTGRYAVVFFAGALIGSLICFTAARMILAKTVRVFDRKFLIKYGAFALTALVFLSFTVFDITGYEKNVPEADDVKRMWIDDDYGSEVDIGFLEESEPIAEANAIRDKETIEKVISFHEAVAEYGNDEQWGKLIYQNEDSFNITYELKNGRKIMRHYIISLTDNPELFEAYEAVFNDKGYRERNKSLTLPKLDALSFITYPTEDGQPTEINLPTKVIREFEKAFNADRKEFTLKDAMKYFRFSAPDTFSIYCSYELGGTGFMDPEVIITPKDKRTQKLLFENGYGRYMTSPSADDE